MNKLILKSIRSASTQNQRSDALALYKRFMYLADDWPQGREVYVGRLKKAFQKNANAGPNQTKKCNR